RYRLRHADASENRVKDSEVCYPRPSGEEQRGERGPRRQDGAAMAVIDQRADRVGREAADREAERRRAVKLGLRQLEVYPHADRDQREGVVERAPRNDLRDAESGHEAPTLPPERVRLPACGGDGQAALDVARR